MSRRISSFTAGLGALLIAGGVYAAPASGPVDKGLDLSTSERNAKKPKPKKGADADEAAEEAEDTDKKSKKGKGKKAKDADADAEAEDEKPKKKGKKAKKEEPPPEEEEEKPKKKGKKGKKEKKEEPPPEEEPVDIKDTESPTATPEADPDEMPPEEPPAEPPPSDEEPKEDEEKADASASVSTADAAGKLYLGLRLGYGIFMGKTTGDDSPIEFTGKIPIWLDLGYRFSPSLLLALYGQYAFASIECPSGFDCSASVMRFGLQVQYGFAPDAKFAPWVGFGVGYEMASGTITVPDFGESKFSLKGAEFANLQLGADFMVSKAVGVGPFLSFSLGRYAAGEVEEAGTTLSGGISKKEFHEWLVLGVRGSFSL